MESYSYTSFGELRQQGSKVKNTYTFTGREWDEEIELYFYRARYYDAEAGRFTSRDPSLSLGGILNIPFLLLQQLEIPQELNPFIYVRNNPINLTDPFGLQAVPSCDYSRYKECNKLGFISKWFCKKAVDFACSGVKEIVCCESERTGCLSCIGCDDPCADSKTKQCYGEYIKCISKVRGSSQ
jgi:RHS repeat-associated protein